MAANSSFPINHYDPDTNSIIGGFSVTPARDRNGVYEYSGVQNNGSIFSAHPSLRITASVRPGTPANFVSKVARVKRRTTLKFAIPIDVPGEVGTIVDYINVDVVFSSPVEATEAQVRHALSMVAGCAFDENATQPLRDMLVNGREPY